MNIVFITVVGLEITPIERATMETVTKNENSSFSNDMKSGKTNCDKPDLSRDYLIKYEILILCGRSRFPGTITFLSIILTIDAKGKFFA